MKSEEIANLARISSLVSIFHARSGHPGGVLSSIDLISVLFNEFLEINKKNIDSLNRNRFIMSKGHCAPAMYSVAAELGIIDKSRLNGLRKLNHELQGHTHRLSTPWAEASTGSLGQGFSFAIGEALGLRLKNIDKNIFVMVGDGELQEGEIWEGAMFSGHHKLNNICAIVDYNKMQSDDLNKNIINLEPLADKWAAFGWDVIDIDGHNFEQIRASYTKAISNQSVPTVIIANTIKGKGVSFMEGSPAWHGSLELSLDDMKHSLKDLGIVESDMEGYLNV